MELIVGDHQVLGVTCHVDDLEHEGETSFQQLLYLLPSGFLTQSQGVYVDHILLTSVQQH